jgi:hypothetical protein
VLLLWKSVHRVQQSLPAPCIFTWLHEFRAQTQCSVAAACYSLLRTSQRLALQQLLQPCLVQHFICCLLALLRAADKAAGSSATRRAGTPAGTTITAGCVSANKQLRRSLIAAN